jgi:hypothetical protein
MTERPPNPELPDRGGTVSPGGVRFRSDPLAKPPSLVREQVFAQSFQTCGRVIEDGQDRVALGDREVEHRRSKGASHAQLPRERPVLHGTGEPQHNPVVDLNPTQQHVAPSLNLASARLREQRSTGGGLAALEPKPKSSRMRSALAPIPTAEPPRRVRRGCSRSPSAIIPAAPVWQTCAGLDGAGLKAGGRPGVLQAVPLPQRRHAPGRHVYCDDRGVAVGLLRPTERAAMLAAREPCRQIAAPSEGEKPAPSWRPRSRRQMSCSIAGKANALVRLLEAPGSSPRVLLQQHRAQFLEARGRVFEGSKDLSPFLDREREDFGPVEQRGIQPARKRWGNNSGELPEQSLVDGYPTHQHSPCPSRPQSRVSLPTTDSRKHVNGLADASDLRGGATRAREAGRRGARPARRACGRSLARSAAKSAC